MSRTLVLESAARSDIGRVRETNQDALVLRPELGLFVVADGMGGHASGELAASIAVEPIAGFFEDPEITWPPHPEGRRERSRRPGGGPDNITALLVRWHS